MARKNLLAGLMADTPPSPEPQAAAPAPPARRTGGAIGAVGQSFAQMRANAVIDIPADMIDGAGLSDRIGDDPAFDSLVASLDEYGQQVPVLVRHSPNTEGRYDVVYGRRRIAALRQLGRSIRAMVRDLPDHDLIVAQGQENTARVDLSFVEKANFARQMVDKAFDRKVICDALSIDKTAVSKLLRVAEAVPLPLIEAIGAAPATGRDRWLALAARLEADPAAAQKAHAAIAALSDGGGSDARFSAALGAAQAPRAAKRPPPVTARRPWGQHVTRGDDRQTVSLSVDDPAFATWLETRLDDLHARFQAEAQDNPATSKED